MTWDPTDKQGWKRTLEVSSSPSAPARPTKKVRFGTTSDTEEVRAINGDVDTNNNIDTIQAIPAKGTAGACELPDAEFGPMRSFFRPKKQRPPPAPVAEPTQSAVDTGESSAQLTAPDAQSNVELYNVLHSPYSQVDTNFNEYPTSSDISTSTHRAHFDHYTDTARSSSNEFDDITAKSMMSASSVFTPPDLLAPLITTPRPSQVEITPMTSAFAKPYSLFSQASTPSFDHQGFLFGNGGDDLDHGYKSEYFDKIKNNPYTSALQPHAPAPGIPVPQNAAEARGLFKRGRYGQPKRDSVPQPPLEELQKVLQDLRKRFAKLKAMCETAGISATGDIWDRTIAIVEGDRPDIKQALDKETGKGLKEYTEQVERWDKAVGHQAILMKRLNYKQQIAELEKKFKEAKSKAAEDGRDGDWDRNGVGAGKEDGGEWKGHKTRFGRRFSGLIEKN
jgi:uncharacterized protein YukE